MRNLLDKKSVVLAVASLKGGGAERFVLTLAKAFVEMGFRVDVVCFRREVHYDLPECEDIFYHFLNYQTFRSLPKKWGLRFRIFAKVFDKYIRDHIGAPCLVLSNLYNVDRALHYSKLSNLIYVLHTVVSIGYDEFSRGSFAAHAPVVRAIYGNRPLVAVSRGVEADYRRHVHDHPDLRTILNPVDRNGVWALSRLFEPDLKSGYLVHVGKFKWQKDHATLIKAYAQTSRKFPLVLLGQGPGLDACRQLAKDLEVDRMVIFAGFQKNPYPFIRNATAMVLSSRVEGFGLVIAEALALDVPVISTDCESGPRELLPPHCLVPVGDVSALAKKMDEVLNNPGAYKAPFNEALLPENVAKDYLSVIQRTL